MLPPTAGLRCPARVEILTYSRVRSGTRISIRGTPCFDAHINLLKSERVIPHSSGKPDLGF
jgi:hypothetical protein